MTASGERRSRITFQEPVTVSDGYGNDVQGFENRFTVWASIKTIRTGETVMAGRLAGKQTVVLNVRFSGQTRRITTDWRGVDAREPEKAFNVRSVTNVDEKNAEFDILAESGVAT